MSTEQFIHKPDMKISVKQTFGFESEMQISAFSKKNDYVPKIDTDYKFDKDTTLEIIAGFSFPISPILHSFIIFSPFNMLLFHHLNQILLQY